MNVVVFVFVWGRGAVGILVLFFSLSSLLNSQLSLINYVNILSLASEAT